MSHEDQRRVNVTPQAKQYRTEGFRFTPDTRLPLGEVEPDSLEAKALWKKYKPELYALGSIFADRIVTAAVQSAEERFWYINQRDPFTSLGRKMQNHLYTHLAIEAMQMESANASPQLVSAYKRLDMLTWFLYEVIPSKREEPGVRRLMKEGIGTATETMSGILGVIPKVYPEKHDPDQLSAIAENSFPLVAQLASEHAEQFVPKIDSLRALPGMPFLREKFILKEIRGKQYLAISEYGQVRFDEVDQEFDEKRADISPTVGCLAMINFGEGSAVRKSWKICTTSSSTKTLTRRLSSCSF